MHLVHLCVPSIQHSLSHKYLLVDSMGLKGEFRNEDVKSGVLATWKTKAERNISKKETLNKVRSILWI